MKNKPHLRMIKPEVQPEHMSLYPTMDSICEAIAYIESQVPVTQPNQMFSLLMMFQNTLIKELNTHNHRDESSHDKQPS